MRHIELVFASSVDEIAAQRKDWETFIRKINDVCAPGEICFDLTVCKELSGSILKKMKQAKYNTKICASQYFFVLFGEMFGESLQEQLDTALRNVRKAGKPSICGYTMLEKDALSSLVKDYIMRLEKETGRGAIAVPNEDSIKLYMLLELVKGGAICGQLRLQDGQAVLNGKPVLSLENVPIYSKNQFVQKLIREKRIAMIDRREMAARFLREQEMDVLKLCHRTAERVGYMLPTLWREEKAMMLVNRGDYENAVAVLRDPEWEEELQHAEELAEADLGIIWGYILGKAALVDIIMATGTNMEALQEIDALYLKITAMAEKYQVGMLVMYDYLEFLDSQDRFEECVDVATKLRDYEVKTGVPKENLAKTNSMLAGFLLRAERAEEAVKLYNEVLEVYVKLGQSYLPQATKAVYNLAYALNENHQKEEAETWYREALNSYRLLAGTNPEEYYPEVAKTSINLSFLFFETGRRDQAKAMLDAAVHIYTRLGMEEDRKKIQKLLDALS